MIINQLNFVKSNCDYFVFFESIIVFNYKKFEQNEFV